MCYLVRLGYATLNEQKQLSQENWFYTEDVTAQIYDNDAGLELFTCYEMGDEEKFYTLYEKNTGCYFTRSNDYDSFKDFINAKAEHLKAQAEKWIKHYGYASLNKKVEIGA